MPQVYKDIGLIILAAGSSSRLGRPKQLLPYKETTLIGHAVDTALKSGCKPVVVVTGAIRDEILAKITSPEVKTIYNKDWADGMASSIRCGVVALEEIQTTKISGILIMLCDQPMITCEHLKTLCEAFIATDCTAPVATGYSGVTGVPAVFPDSMFDQLYHLQGEEGARKLLALHRKVVTVIPFNDAVLDIDTPEDYQRLTNP